MISWYGLAGMVFAGPVHAIMALSFPLHLPSNLFQSYFRLRRTPPCLFHLPALSFILDFFGPALSFILPAVRDPLETVALALPHPMFKIT